MGVLRWDPVHAQEAIDPRRDRRRHRRAAYDMGSTEGQGSDLWP
jgi:hypothetical protein